MWRLEQIMEPEVDPTGKHVFTCIATNDIDYRCFTLFFSEFPTEEELNICANSYIQTVYQVAEDIIISEEQI